jgi:HSP20 family protein
MMDDFFRPWAPLSRMESRLMGFAPAVDVTETDKEYKVTVEAPGIAKDELEVTINDGYLTIRGEKKEEQKEEKENYVRVERRYGSFHRDIPLPGGVKEDEVEATYKDGVLSIRLPKSPEAAGKRVEIKGG